MRKFLSETSHKIEFSHTILHNQRVEIANKVIRMPEQVQQSEQERARLKEQAVVLQQKMEQKKLEEAKQREELQRKKEDERFKKEQDLQRKKELDPYRNLVLEEVALQFDMMPALGDTAASFAAFVRNMKR